MEKKINRREFNGTAPLLVASIASIAISNTDNSEAQTADNDYYALSRKINGLKIPEAVTVIGIGGSGSWPALYAAMSGVKSILITDMARVEAMDIGRTPYRPSDIGRLKTDALSDIIHFFRPDVAITTNNRKLEAGDTDIFHGSALFNGVDYKPLTAWLPKATSDRGMRYVHCFYYGNEVGVTSSDTPNIEYVPGREVPVWTGSAALAGCLAVFSAFSKPIEFLGDPSQLSIHPKSVNAMFTGAQRVGA